MKEVYTLVKKYDRYFELLCTYKSKKRAKKDRKKLVKEIKQMGFVVHKHGPYYEVYDYHDYHEYDLYIQPMEYKEGN